MQLSIICWNIQDLGTSQVNDNAFLDMIVEVIHHHTADLVCILETKADEGNRLGGLLVGKLNTKTAKAWSHSSSVKSGPSSNKPENYVFLWDTAVVTGTANWKISNDPATLGFPNKHIKCRFPYQGDITVNGKTITVVGFHTCFEAIDIVESNQSLADIHEIRTNANVIVMGDFNDKAKPGKGARPKRRGRTSFHDLYAMGGTAAEHYECALDEKTSLKTVKQMGAHATTGDARCSFYDHFFWRSTGRQFSVVAATTLDVLADLQSGQYLHDAGKAVYNNWATRKNAEEAKPVAIKQRKLKKRPAWIPLVAFVPTDTITTAKKAHDIYRNCISDHLPIRLVITVS